MGSNSLFPAPPPGVADNTLRQYMPTIETSRNRTKETTEDKVESLTSSYLIVTSVNTEHPKFHRAKKILYTTLNCMPLSWWTIERSILVVFQAGTRDSSLLRNIKTDSWDYLGWQNLFQLMGIPTGSLQGLYTPPSPYPCFDKILVNFLHNRHTSTLTWA